MAAPPAVGPRGDDIRVMAGEHRHADHGAMQPVPRVHNPERTMNLLNRLWSCLTPTAASHARLPAPNDAGSDGDPPCQVCGWFDSSHELQTGLQISEHDDDEVVAAALPLATWLELQLADWQPVLRVDVH